MRVEMFIEEGFKRIFFYVFKDKHMAIQDRGNVASER